MARARLTPGVLVLLAVAGCGDDQPSRTPGASAQGAKLLAAAIAHVEHVSSYRLTMTLHGHTGGKDVRMQMHVATSLDNSRVRGHMDYREGQLGVSGELILVGGEGYLRSRRLDTVLPPGKQWLRVSDPSLTQQGLSPSQFFDLIRDTTGARIVGKDEILGHPATHLRALVNMRKLLQRVPDGPVAQQIRLAGADAFDRVHMSVDIWVDASDAMRRMTAEVSQRGTDNAMAIDMVMERENVSLKSVRPPRPAIVVDEADVGKGG